MRPTGLHLRRWLFPGISILFEFAVLGVAPIHSSKTGPSDLFLLTRKPVGSQACVIRTLAETSILQDAIEFGCLDAFVDKRCAKV